MTGKGQNAFAMTIIGIWAGAIAAVAIIVTLLIFAPWVLAIIFVILGAIIYKQRRDNLAKKAAEANSVDAHSETDEKPQ